MSVLGYVPNTKNVKRKISATLGHSAKVRIPKIVITKPKTTTMYYTHAFGSAKCMWVVHSGGFRVSGHGFGFTYLTRYQRVKDPGQDQFSEILLRIDLHTCRIHIVQTSCWIPRGIFRTFWYEVSQSEQLQGPKVHHLCPDYLGTS